ncbi:MAG TPA: hypothetical protein VNM68_05455 [Candidatus Polarisedimenticolia bacterium]|nr:hypothetical protein [Candidatus Polarisedimenticolia bacterium]
MTKHHDAQLQRPLRASSLSYHERNCTICRHPERDAIEEAFLQWRNVSNIKLEFKLPSRTSLYRHAHALGLFARRGRNLRFALEHIIESAEAITPTADAVIRAVHAYTRLNDAGQWIEPPAHVVVSSGSALHASLRPDASHSLPLRVDLAALPCTSAPASDTPEPLLQPGTPARAEIDATH